MSQNEIIAIEDKVNLINHYEAIAKDASEKADEIKTEIKGIMTEKGLETISTPSYIIRFIDVLSSRLNTKALKEDLGPELYSLYCRQVASKKFTITQ